jgi:hypothetical protein
LILSRLEIGTLEAASSMVQRGAQKELIDYDNHLDDIGKDFLNIELNAEIDDAAGAA